MNTSSNKAIRKKIAIESGIVNFLLYSLQNKEIDLVKEWVCANFLSTKALSNTLIQEYFNSSQKTFISMCIKHHEQVMPQTLTKIFSEIGDQGLLKTELDIIEQIRHTFPDNHYAEELLGAMHREISDSLSV